jgi:hypothetical protein
VNANAPHTLIVGLQPEQNAVVLQVPRGGELTAPQQALVDEARNKYSTAVRVGVYDGTPAPRSCNYPFCDPPLRGGIRIFDPDAICTGGFAARSRSDAKLYLLTAGHCRGLERDWSTRFASDNSTHVLGRFHSSVFSRDGDAGILDLNNPDGWMPRGGFLLLAVTTHLETSSTVSRQQARAVLGCEFVRQAVPSAVVTAAR